MKVNNVLICEDIRMEVGNKLSAMGIFGDTLNIDIPEIAATEPQAAVILAALITIEKIDSKTDPKDYSIIVSIALGKNIIGKMIAKGASAGNGKILHLTVPKFSVPLLDSDKLFINVQLTKKEKVTNEYKAILNINVTKTAP